MAYPFVLDFVKAKRGREINEAFINISSSYNAGHAHIPTDGCEEGSTFRDIKLPKMCVRNSMPDDVITSHQAEYDRLEYGDEFSMWLFSASGFNAEYKLDFEGKITQLTHVKVEKSGPCDWYTTDYALSGRFRKKDPNVYERIFRRILGESGFNYVRRWKISKDLFVRENIRTEPLTTHEIECLLEYEKYKILTTYRQPDGRKFSNRVARHDQLRQEAIQQAKEAERTA
eukprot:GEMP01092310.1.p1 GENE.GEMP01092310.1~~GEMP01092310.1.p1  ORF type:complete len:229 (+),score=26.34 GEMP01092310.1:54-740(+)